MRSLTPAQIRQIDSIAINTYGITGITLMENAGYAVAKVAKQALNDVKDKKICVLCGKGNNGGDGLVASRHLINSSFRVDVYILAKTSSIRGEARFNLKLLEYGRCKINEIVGLKALHRFVNKFDYSLIVDAIFGTGFSGTSISEPARSLISFINTIGRKTISIDIPSGLNGSSGRVDDVAIQSDITVTLGLPKRGLFLKQGPSHIGKLIVKNIGFPNRLLKKS